ncbi:MAG: sugar transferase [Oscillospiraceae bacterium]|nr:sugar transferase [Oscillospiraceae bacterium]
MSKNNNIKETTSTEKLVNVITLNALKENKEGITNYPILDFDKRGLSLLCEGIKETLKYSSVKPAGGKAYKIIKRGLDIFFSALFLTILIIPMGAIALIIYHDDKGNPIFSQIRLTENGKPFKMYKFRSMCIDAEEKFKDVQKMNETDGLAFKNENDPRITKIGSFIRKTSIDELPQLWNVLKGEMSFIGPRPALPREIVMYTPEHMNRLLVKAGLACICQCEGRSNVEFEKGVQSDIKYIKERSLLLDTKIAFKTIAVVIKRDGAK